MTVFKKYNTGTAAWEAIAVGQKGDKGDPGNDGAGVPVGGTTGQSLVKASNTDYDVTWSSDFATSAQGALADTALQPADVGTAAAADTGDFATSAQGSLADTALQPADVGTIASQDANSVNIDGGTIDSTAVNATTLTASGDVNFDSGTLFVDVSEDNVGIGTTSPTVPMTIGPSALPTGAVVDGLMVSTERTGQVGVVNTRLCSAAGNPVINQLTAAGTVDSPEIVVNGRGLGRNNWYGFDGVRYINAVTIVAQVDGPPDVDDMPGRLLFLTTPSGGTTPAERMRIDSSGNVGISTTSPTEKLHVSGNILASGNITGGSINDTPIGAGTASTGEFTSLTINNEIVENVFALSGTTPALDPANGTIQTWTLTGNSTPTSSLVSGESILLLIDDGTAYTITWPTMEWIGGSAPTLDTANTNVIEIWNVSGTLYGALVGVAS